MALGGVEFSMPVGATFWDFKKTSVLQRLSHTFEPKFKNKTCLMRSIRRNWSQVLLASETLTGVTQTKIGDVCLLSREIYY